MSMTKPVERTLACTPSARLLRAAVSGLLAASAAACTDDESNDGDRGHEHDDELSDAELSAVCKDKVDQALEDQDLDKMCADTASAAQSERDQAKKEAANDKDQLAKLTDSCQPLLATREEKATNSEQKEYTFAQLTKMCDERGGYTQIAAACGGHNTCKGFSYGDWGPGAATLTEHSCAGANGCLGVQCVETAKDQKRSPEDLYAMKYDDPGPSACTSCHTKENANGDPDTSTFIVWTYDQKDNPWAGPERTIDNWKDTRSAAMQERIVAFGVPFAVLPDGTAVNHMAPYYKYLSRNEIASLVKYIREELTPSVSKVKTKDPK
jgi:mono/diheme cytochrome c family protein